PCARADGAGVHDDTHGVGPEGTQGTRDRLLRCRPPRSDPREHHGEQAVHARKNIDRVRDETVNEASINAKCQLRAIAVSSCGSEKWTSSFTVSNSSISVIASSVRA